MTNNHPDALETLERRLRAAGALDAADFARARRKLAEEAVAAGLVDVAFERHDCPLGTLLLGATETGLVRVGLPAEGEDAVLEDLGARISPRVLRASRESVTRARRELDEYFAGRRRGFDVPLDLRLARGFRRVVLEHLRAVAYGTTVSYAQLAAASGNARAVRATGTACAHNPLPLVVPCHRVLRSDGKVGAYLGGTSMKQELLALERERRTEAD
jgi:methylated-DNA-[protein]-cysteine S-methyltransferase